MMLYKKGKKIYFCLTSCQLTYFFGDRVSAEITNETGHFKEKIATCLIHLNIQISRSCPRMD